MREGYPFRSVAIAALAMLALFLAVPSLREGAPAPPDDARDLAPLITRSPASADVLSKTLDTVLDSPLPGRFEAWHAAHRQAALLDPHRPAAAVAFVRSGFFHYYELSDADRGAVKDAIEPLLRDRDFFASMAQHVWEATGDFALLRRANPGTDAAMQFLSSLAVSTGRFADYRALRTQRARRRFDDFQLTRHTAPVPELIALVPAWPRSEDAPLIRGLLAELHDRPVDANPSHPDSLSALIAFALRHQLQPLDGLEAVTRISESASDPLRARLAVRLGDLTRASDLEISTRGGTAAEWATYHLEHAIADAEHHDPIGAQSHLQKAENAAPPAEYFAAAAHVAQLTNNRELADRAQRGLAANVAKIQRWEDLCGSDICYDSHALVWTAGAPLPLRVDAVQSDNVPPFVELYADDTLLQDGPVAQSVVVNAALPPGLHRIDINVANPVTRNAMRRLVRAE